MECEVRHHFKDVKAIGDARALTRDRWGRRLPRPPHSPQVFPAVGVYIEGTSKRGNSNGQMRTSCLQLRCSTGRKILQCILPRRQRPDGTCLQLWTSRLRRGDGASTR